MTLSSHLIRITAEWFTWLVFVAVLCGWQNDDVFIKHSKTVSCQQLKKPRKVIGTMMCYFICVFYFNFATIYGEIMMYMYSGCVYGSESCSNCVWWCTRHFPALYRLTSMNFAFPSRSLLRSAAHGTLFVPRTRLELGKRAFVGAAPAAWNSLPDDVRSVPTLDEFKQCLKTHLFIQSYYL